MKLWEDIKGYEGLYRVNRFGDVEVVSRRVVNHKSGSTRLMQSKKLTPFDNGHGYLVVSLRKDGKRKNHYIHRLVAEAFIENADNKPNVNHRDYNTKNNYVGNLEWCTQKENASHSAEHMKKPKSVCRTTNTGEKYISRRTEHGKFIRYRVTIRPLGVDKWFKTLDDAIQYRNEVMQSG